MARIGTPVTGDISSLVFYLESPDAWKRGAQQNASGGAFNQPITTEKAHQKIWEFNNDMLAGLLSAVIGEGALPGYPVTIAAVDDELEVTVTGGIVNLQGLFTFDALTISLTANTTHYLYLTMGRELVSNTTGNAPIDSMYVGTVVMGANEMTSADTLEQWVVPGFGRDRLLYNLMGGLTVDREYGVLEKVTSKTITGNVTLTNKEARANILVFSGTAAGDITLPAIAGKRWLIQNKTTQTLAFIRTGQTPGVSIATLKMAELFSDGTDILRATADVAY